jgi:hypothetical protein
MKRVQTAWIRDNRTGIIVSANQSEAIPEDSDEMAAIVACIRSLETEQTTSGLWCARIWSSRV